MFCKILSTYLLVLKMSSIRLHCNNFWSSKTSRKTKNCYPEDVSKMSSRHVFKTSSRHLFKMSWPHVFKKSSIRLGDKKMGYLYLTNLNRYASNKSIFHKSISDESKANPKSLIRTHWFQYSSYFEIQATFLFWE